MNAVILLRRSSSLIFVRLEPFWRIFGFSIEKAGKMIKDRKSTRLNSSHVAISYAVFCLKKKIHLTYFFESVNLSKNAGVTISFEGIDLERVKNKQDTVIDVA